MRNAFAATILAMSCPFTPSLGRIAALGDSLTQGYGLAPEDGFVPQLAGAGCDAAGGRDRS